MKSKVGRNLKTQKKVRTQSANLQARKAAHLSFAEQRPDDVKQLICDLNVSYEELGCLPRRADLSPER